MNGVHLHLVFNHAPVLGAVFALGLLGYGWLARREEAVRISLGTFVVAALAAILAFATGEPAEEMIEHGPRAVHALVESHETAAGVALGFSIAAGVLALGALVVPRLAAGRFAALRRHLVIATASAGIASAILMGVAANLGGRIAHPEIRGGAAPTAGKHHDD